MAAARVSIPAAVRRMIENIKEIAGGHTDEEVYTALRECNMDPNETAQKLLLQDTFHEVKRKRDKKKESKESADPQWRPGTKGQGGKGGRGNYSSRQLSNSSELIARNALVGKENGVNPNMDSCSSPANPKTDTKTSTSILSLLGGLSDCPSQPVAPMEKNSLATCHLPTSYSKELVDVEGTTVEVVVTLGPDVSQSSIQSPTSVSGVSTTSLDPVLTPSLEAHRHGKTSVAKHAFGNQLAAEVSDDVSAVPKDTSQPSGSPSIVLPAGSRPSSSYSSRSQQLSGSQKGTTATTTNQQGWEWDSQQQQLYQSKITSIPNKEWKPKLTNKPTQAEIVIRDHVPVTVDPVPQSDPVSNSTHKEDISSKVDKRLSDMQLSDKQHVIIPDHLQVTESEKYVLSFGSFGTIFEQTVAFPKDVESEKTSAPHEYESSQEGDEAVDEPATSHQGVSSTGQKLPEAGLQHLPVKMTGNISPQVVDNSSGTPEVAECDQSKDAAASHIPQDSFVQATPCYLTFALAPQSQGDQIPLLETSESQVQQPNEFSGSYYAPLYRPIADVDGRLSPFTAPGAAIKYGNISVLSAQTGQTQELPQAVNSLVLYSSGATPLATPSPGAVPSSIAVPQQPLPVFRQPVGVQLPHYQPRFIPYNQYISPFYVPPHTLHPFMGNPVFPQPPSTGGMYTPAASAAVAPPVKYSAITYKPGANTGSQTNALNPGAYGTYGSSPSIYTNNTVVASGISTENDDGSGSQFKENIYIAGQQSQGSTVWIAAPGRDISGLQSGSFYGQPLQGQHLAFSPAQTGHGAYGGMYHPAQTMTGGAVHPLLQPSQTIAGAVEMVGPSANGYQQPQRARMNWGNY